MLVAQSVVYSRIREMAVLRLGGHMVEMKERGVRKCDRIGSDLIVSLIVAKEEHLVLLDRPSDRASELPSHEKWVENPGATG